MPEDTFHAGELALQAETGVRARLAQAGPRFIRDHMPDQHREFFAQLPFLVLGSLDAQGRPVASLLAGPPGFVQSPDARTLRIAAAAGLPQGAPVGLLGIEPHTRRRNRANGQVAALAEQGFDVAVTQSFGNCPKYIQPRRAEFDPSAARATPPREMAVLDSEALALVRAADTFFIASAHPHAAGGAVRAHGVDVSHRGGPAGFVQAAGDGAMLTVADFVGNFYFNTLGNLLLNPACGLLFLDFASGTMLQVAAQAEVVRDEAGRRLALRVASARLTAHAVPLRWHPVPPVPL